MKDCQRLKLNGIPTICSKSIILALAKKDCLSIKGGLLQVNQKDIINVKGIGSTGTTFVL
eukprot:5124790-Amphidinium_carterae.1